MCSALAPTIAVPREQKVRQAEGRSFLASSELFPLLSLQKSGRIIHAHPSPGEAFCAAKWRNSLTDCSPCQILQIRTNNRLNCSADLFLMSATHYLTLGSRFQMWSYWLGANTGISLGLYNPPGLFSGTLPSPSYITQGSFLSSHRNQPLSKFRPEKLFSKLPHHPPIFSHL